MANDTSSGIGATQPNTPPATGTPGDQPNTNRDATGAPNTSSQNNAGGAGADGNTGATGGDKTGADGAGNQNKANLMDGGTDKNTAQPTDWPTDWRQKALTGAGLPADDKKALALLERLATPADMAKKLIEQEKLIREGRHKVGFPTEGTAEQQAAWRKDNDIPEAPEKYNLSLPDGLVVGEQDMPIVQGIAKALHGVNASQAQVTAALAEYYRQEKSFLTERENQITDFKTKQDDQLHADFGEEYRKNMNISENWLQTMPQNFRDIVAGGFDQNGMPLRYNAEFIKGLVTTARTINPVDLVVGGVGTSQASTVADEIAAIEKRMSDDRDGYYKDERMQQRYRDLITWQENNKRVA